MMPIAQSGIMSNKSEGKWSKEKELELGGDMGLIKGKRISLRLGEYMETKRQEGLKEKNKERKKRENKKRV
jgi:hypothetical protein